MKLETKPRGRPRKTALGQPTANFTMRISPDLYEELRLAAVANDRSISAEATHRLKAYQANADIAARLDRIEISLGPKQRVFSHYEAGDLLPYAHGSQPQAIAVFTNGDRDPNYRHTSNA